MTHIYHRLRFVWRARKYAVKWEPAEIAFLKRYLQPGNIVFDVGCHKGGYLYWMRKKIGRSGGVFAFEPQPGLFNYLEQIVKMYGWDNVQVENKGLGNAEGSMELIIPAPPGSTSPGASFCPATRPDGLESHSCYIPMTTLDQYQKSNRIKRIDFMKVDVEGFELNVFKGAHETLQEKRPVILFESEARHLYETTLNDVFDCLHQLDYKGFFFEHRKIRSIEEFRPEIHQKQEGPRYWDGPDYHNNFLFFPDESAYWKYI